jgi:hypothetical protein
MRDEIETLAHGLPQKDNTSLNNTNSTVFNYNSLFKREKSENLESPDNKTNNKLNSDSPIINEHVETLHQKISELNNYPNFYSLLTFNFIHKRYFKKREDGVDLLFKKTTNSYSSL